MSGKVDVGWVSHLLLQNPTLPLSDPLLYRVCAESDSTCFPVPPSYTPPGILSHSFWRALPSQNEIIYSSRTKLSDSLELEIQVAVTHPVSAGIQTQIL